MKVIIAGASGLIGRAVLGAAIQDPRITGVVAVVRRPLPADLTESTEGREITNGEDAKARASKVTTLIPRDFAHYTADEIDVLSGAEAVIWSIGLTPSKPGDFDYRRKVDVEYMATLARLAQSELQTRQPNPKTPFRFVYCSVRGAERDQSRPLWFMPGSRRIKGLAENELVGLRAQHTDTFDPYIIKTGSVRPGMDGVKAYMPASVFMGDVEFARVLLHIALHGNEQKELTMAYMWQVHGRLDH